MTSTYQVLLQRENGFNKTIYLEDCYSEQEAKEIAEEQYGLPVLRVLYESPS